MKNCNATELDALQKNNTWTFVEPPTNTKLISSKWIFRIKRDPTGVVIKYKAHLVAKGYLQRYGLDFKDIFAPVAKVVTVRILLTLAAQKGWYVHKLDINNAFLHGSIDEGIYLLPPQGSDAPKGHICKLNKSMYGLKQASRQWYKELSTSLIQFGFEQSSYDHCLFMIKTDTLFVALIIYVDDILLTGTDVIKIQEIKNFLHNKFTIKDMGEAEFFLGIEIHHDQNGISISQRKYILDILQEPNFMDTKACATPLPSGWKLHSKDGQPLEKPE